MAYIPPRDRVQERATGSGPGDLVIDPVPNMRRFLEAGVSASGDTMDYVIVAGAHVEIGIAPFAIEAGSNVLKRATGLVKYSTNSNALVSFPAGVKDVFNDASAHVLNKMLRGDIAQSFPVADRNRMLASLGITYHTRQLGDVILKAGLVADPGAAVASGALLDRVVYADLWDWANTPGNTRLVTDAVWGSGNYGCFSTGTNGSNFRIPYLYGEFMRFLDLAGSYDPGRLLGSFQNHQFQSHAHAASSGDDAPDHSHLYETAGNKSGLAPPSGSAINWQSNVGNPLVSSGGASNRHQHAIFVGNPNSGNHGAETRPRNVALLACIQVTKYV